MSLVYLDLSPPYRKVLLRSLAGVFLLSTTDSILFFVGDKTEMTEEMWVRREEEVVYGTSLVVRTRDNLR